MPNSLDQKKIIEILKCTLVVNSLELFFNIDYVTYRLCVEANKKRLKQLTDPNFQNGLNQLLSNTSKIKGYLPRNSIICIESILQTVQCRLVMLFIVVKTKRFTRFWVILRPCDVKHYNLNSFLLSELQQNLNSKFVEIFGLFSMFWSRNYSLELNL